MALKDIWVNLENKVEGDPESGSDITVEPINNIANAVIELEEEAENFSINIDSEMSDTSKNAVQNKVIKAYVDEITGDIETALDDIIAIQNSLIGGDNA